MKSNTTNTDNASLNFDDMDARFFADEVFVMIGENFPIPSWVVDFAERYYEWKSKLPVTKEGAEKDIYHSLLSNSLRLLSDEQRAGLIAALFVRSSNWDYIVSEINRTNEVEGRKIYVTSDKSLIEHSCDAPLKTCATIEQIRGKNLRKLHAVSEDKDLWLESEVNDILIRNDDTLYEIKETSKVYTSFKQINKS